MSPQRTRRLLGGLAACAVALATATAPAIAAPADPAPLLLRLPDLGPGYVIAKPFFSRAQRSCTKLRPSRPGMRDVLGRGPYRGCWLSFQRAWTTPGDPPGPGGVQSLAFAFDSPEGPTTALSRPRTLPLPYLDGRYLRIVQPAPAIGDQAVLMRVDRTILGLPFSAGVVAWRSGSVLGIIVAASLTRGDANARAAVRLAAVQQARIANPTPLRPPVNDDRLVPLDDPTLGVPVMWLGEQIPAHGRFPALKLRETFQPFALGTRPQPLVRLVYHAPGQPGAANVGLWRPRDLHREFHRPPDHPRCKRRFDGGLGHVHSAIVATYARKHGRCPRRGAIYAAVAFFDGVGVAIDASGCCRSAANPYNSLAGLRTLLRALRPREPSAAPAP